MSTLRRHGGRVYYEAGEALEFAYPNFTNPTARLTFLRNPSYGPAHEIESLPQGMTQTPTGRALATSIASDPVRFLPYSWQNMQEGWPQAQRIDGTVILHADTPNDAALAAAPLLVTLGFRSFDGVEPEALQLLELNSVGTTLVTHDFTVGVRDLVRYPQGALRRLELSFTAHASCNALRVRAESTGQDFAIADVHASHAAGDAYGTVDFVFDDDSDGVANGWSVAGGSAAGCSHYGEDAAGLREWIREVCDGALKTFEVRRPGIGVIAEVRLVEPIQEIGFALQTGSSVGDVRLRLEEIP